MASLQWAQQQQPEVEDKEGEEGEEEEESNITCVTVPWRSNGSDVMCLWDKECSEHTFIQSLSSVWMFREHVRHFYSFYSQSITKRGSSGWTKKERQTPKHRLENKMLQGTTKMCCSFINFFFFFTFFCLTFPVLGLMLHYC